MTRSTARGLLYTAPPTEERTDGRSDQDGATITTDADGTSHASAADD